MVVAVDQPGDHEHPAEVDLVAGAPLAELLHRADRGDLVPVDLDVAVREDAALPIDRDDVTVLEQQRAHGVVGAGGEVNGTLVYHI